MIPVVDLRLKFDMDEDERTDQTCIIMVQVNDVEMGILVDCVGEAQGIPAESV